MYMLDTNICIYAINRKSQLIIDKVKSLKPHQIKLSSVSLAELEYGVSKSRFREKNRCALLNFVSAFDILPFDDNDTEIYGILRADLEQRGQIIGSYDLQIASQAIARNLTLVSNNTDEFNRIKNLKLENWV
ncbi:MAG TPA: VapC toxin family PIN domain ribonuclease [Lentisphaeria bacterium]|nr:MAG: twitching motility protein PilT [Lentisphaerae bacterium GWF2_38_69]HBM16347.1 VapC toxin family PIN domain ribonuclease [Lentisphaeria bacterium]